MRTFLYSLGYWCYRLILVFGCLALVVFHSLVTFFFGDFIISARTVHGLASGREGKFNRTKQWNEQPNNPLYLFVANKEQARCKPTFVLQLTSFMTFEINISILFDMPWRDYLLSRQAIIRVLVSIVPKKRDIDENSPEDRRLIQCLALSLLRGTNEFRWGSGSIQRFGVEP